MIASYALLRFRLAEIGSLKDKRMIARSLLDGVRNRFNVTAAETEDQDNHHILSVGVAVVSGEKQQADKMLDGVIRWMEEHAEGAELFEISRDEGTINT